MSDIIITVENLSKKYLIGHQPIKGEGLRHKIEGAMRNPLIWLKERSCRLRGAKEEFWALMNVSFEVKQGEILGIIGRNGAGKSTLLKVLSRITEPTSGRICLKGRVASLLEVGTGFHQELTGRENIFLNGAILGMTKAEIKRKFDEIVAFAEIEKFLDTPVKRYSSGMYVRLAFAVAAHLEPEILIVDEVLAVGDAEFQQKCLGKIGDVAKGGRTVLFVSHDMYKITRLCQQALLLVGGQVKLRSSVTDVVAYYRDAGGSAEGAIDLRFDRSRSGNGAALFSKAELLNEGVRTGVFNFGCSLTLRTTIEVVRPIIRPYLAAVVATSDGVPVHGLESLHERLEWNPSPGRHEIDIRIEQLLLFPGAYSIDLWLGDSQADRIDYVRGVLTFQVVQTPSSGLDTPLQRANGLVFIRSQWKQRALA